MTEANSANDILRTARLFELYVKAVWPIHRLFVKHKLSKRCNRCAASEKMLPINHLGYCLKCQNLEVSSSDSEPKMEKEIYQIFNKYQNQGKGKYDALVLFSGGKDSAYMIRRLQNEHPKLRLLAFTLDNGFMSPIAKQNIITMLPKLNVDHFFYHAPKDFHKKLFRYTITHLNSMGGYGTVDFSDGEFLLDTARNIAYDREIPLIICGYSRYQVQNGLGLHHFESPIEVESSDRTHTAGIAIDKIFVNQIDRKFWWRGAEKNKSNIARLMFPLYAWDLEEAFIKAEVVKWGLINIKNHSPIVTNHLLIPLIGVVDVHKLGYSSFEIEFCRMIREGKANVNEWFHVFEFLEYASRTGLFVNKAVAQGLEYLDLNLNDVGVKYI